MKIMKFFGPSLGSSIRLLHAAYIVRDYFQKEKCIVVVTSFEGIEDSLLEISQQYSQNPSNALSRLMKIYQYHYDLAEDFKFTQAENNIFEKRLKSFFEQFIQERAKNKISNHKDMISLKDNLSTLLFVTALERSGMKAQAVDTSLAFDTDNLSSDSIEAMYETIKKGENIVAPFLKENIVPVMSEITNFKKHANKISQNDEDIDSMKVLAYLTDADDLVLWKEKYERENLIQKKFIRINKEKIQTKKKELIIWIKNIFSPKQRGYKIGHLSL